MKWPLTWRVTTEALANEVVRLRAELTEARKQERVAEEVRQANADRDVWAAKVQEMENHVDARVNAGVAAALTAIELAQARGTTGGLSISTVFPLSPSAADSDSHK